MTRMKLLAAPLAASLLAAALGGWILVSGEEATQASPTLTIGVDANPSGNTATTLGAIDDCREVSNGQTFDVDIYITDVVDLLAWQMVVNYEGSIVTVKNANLEMFQAAQPDSDVFSRSDPKPDTDGGFTVYAANLSVTRETGGDSGSGVLARLTLGAAESGVTPITLGAVTLKDKDNVAIGDTDGDTYYDAFNYSAWVAVDQQCPDEPPPTATPVITPTIEPPPTASPVATPTPEPSPSASPTATPTPAAPPAVWTYSCYLGSRQSTEDALAAVSGDVLAAYRLRPDQGFDRWFPGMPTVSTMTELNPHDALFLLVADDATWPQDPSGEPPSDANLVFGWNSVCYVGQTKEAETATQGIDGEFAIAYTLPPGQAWQRFVPGMPEASTLTQLDSFTPVLILVTEESGALWEFEP